MAETRHRRERVLNGNASWKRVIRIATALIAVCLVAAVGAQGASAETTHRFLRYVTLPVGGAAPLGVDQSGNIIVWSDETNEIYKFSQNGAPVDFSGLGTNVLDGMGGFNCPSVASDCDRLPFTSAGFGNPPTLARDFLRADMNQSTEGPQAGWIYVEAIVEIRPVANSAATLSRSTQPATTEAKFDETKVTPFAPAAINSKVNGNGVANVVNVSPGGTSTSFRRASRSGTIEKFQPVDEDAPHDVYIGQLRKTNGGVDQRGPEFQADDNSRLVGHGVRSPDLGEVRRQWHSPFRRRDAYPIDLSPDRVESRRPGPGRWRTDEKATTSHTNRSASILKPTTSSSSAAIRASSRSGTKTTKKWVSSSAARRSSTRSADATSYSARSRSTPRAAAPTGGSTSRAAASNWPYSGRPVPVPDVHNLQVTPSHTGGHVTATVDLAHGPKATSCRIQWAEEPEPEQPIFYFESTPCSPAAPYPEEQTSISADMTASRPSSATG